MFGNFTKEEKEQWDKINKNNKGTSGTKLYSFVLWVVLIISFMSGVGTTAIAKTSIHEIYASISFLIATIVFCTIAMMAKIDSLKG